MSLYTISPYASPYLLNYAATQKTTIQKRKNEDLEAAIRESYAKYADKFPATYVERLQNEGVLDRPVQDYDFVGPQQPKQLTLQEEMTRSQQLYPEAWERATGRDYTPVPTGIQVTSPFADMMKQERDDESYLPANVDYERHMADFTEVRRNAQDQIRELSMRMNDVQNQIRMETARVKAQSEQKTEPSEQELRKKSPRYNLLVQEEEQLGAKITELSTTIQNIDTTMQNAPGGDDGFDPINEADKNFSGIGDFNPMDLEKEYVPVTMEAESAETRAAKIGMEDTIISPTFSLDSFVRGIPGMPTVEAMEAPMEDRIYPWKSAGNNYGLDTGGIIGEVDQSLAKMEADSYGQLEQPRPSTQQDQLEQLGIGGRTLIEGGASASAYQDQSQFDEADRRAYEELQNRTPEEQELARLRVEQYKLDNNFDGVANLSQIQSPIQIQDVLPSAYADDSAVILQPTLQEEIAKSQKLNPEAWAKYTDFSKNAPGAVPVPQPEDPISAFNSKLSNTGKSMIDNSLPPTVDSSIEDLMIRASDPRQGFLTSMGYVKVGREGKSIDPTTAEGQVIQSLYARQTAERYADSIQQEYVGKLRRGEISIYDALFNPQTPNQLFTGSAKKGTLKISSTNMPESRRKSIEKYFGERGISLDKPIGSVKWGGAYDQAREATLDDTMGDLGRFSTPENFKNEMIKVEGDTLSAKDQEKQFKKGLVDYISQKEGLPQQPEQAETFLPSGVTTGPEFRNKLKNDWNAQLKEAGLEPINFRPNTNMLVEYIDKEGVKNYEVIEFGKVAQLVEMRSQTGSPASIVVPLEVVDRLTIDENRDGVEDYNIKEAALGKITNKEQREKLLALTPPNLESTLAEIDNAQGYGGYGTKEAQSKALAEAMEQSKNTNPEAWAKAMTWNEFQQSLTPVDKPKTGGAKIPDVSGYAVLGAETLKQFTPFQEAFGATEKKSYADQFKEAWTARQKSGAKLETGTLKFSSEQLKPILSERVSTQGKNIAQLGPQAMSEYYQGVPKPTTAIKYEPKFLKMQKDYEDSVAAHNKKVAEYDPKSDPEQKKYNALIKQGEVIEAKKTELEKYSKDHVIATMEKLPEDKVFWDPVSKREAVKINTVLGERQMNVITAEDLSYAIPFGPLIYKAVKSTGGLDSFEKDVNKTLRQIQIGSPEKPLKEQTAIDNLNVHNLVTKFTAPVVNMVQFGTALGSGIGEKNADGSDKFFGKSTPELMASMGMSTKLKAIPITNNQMLDESLTRTIAFFDKTSNVKYSDDILDRAIGGITEPTIAQFTMAEGGGLVAKQDSFGAGYQAALGEKFVANKEGTGLWEEVQRDPVGWGLNVAGNVLTFKYMLSVFPQVYKGLQAVKESKIGAKIGMSAVLSKPRVHEALAKAITAVVIQDPMPGGKSATKEIVEAVAIKQMLRLGVDIKTAKAVGPHIAKTITDEKMKGGIARKIDTTVADIKAKVQQDPDYFKRIGQKIDASAAIDTLSKVKARMIPTAPPAYAWNVVRSTADEVSIAASPMGKIAGTMGKYTEEKIVPQSLINMPRLEQPGAVQPQLFVKDSAGKTVFDEAGKPKLVKPLTDWERVIARANYSTTPIDNIDSASIVPIDRAIQEYDYTSRMLPYTEIPSRDIYRTKYNPLAHPEPDGLWKLSPYEITEKQGRIEKTIGDIDRRMETIQSDVMVKTREMLPEEQELAQLGVIERELSQKRSSVLEPMEQELSALLSDRKNISIEQQIKNKLDIETADYNKKLGDIDAQIKKAEERLSGIARGEESNTERSIFAFQQDDLKNIIPKLKQQKADIKNTHRNNVKSIKENPDFAAKPNEIDSRISELQNKINTFRNESIPDNIKLSETRAELQRKLKSIDVQKQKRNELLKREADKKLAKLKAKKAKLQKHLEKKEFITTTKVSATRSLGTQEDPLVVLSGKLIPSGSMREYTYKFEKIVEDDTTKPKRTKPGGRPGDTTYDALKNVLARETGDYYNHFGEEGSASNKPSSQWVESFEQAQKQADIKPPPITHDELSLLRKTTSYGKALPLPENILSRYKTAMDIFTAVSDPASSLKKSTVVAAKDKLDWAYREIKKGNIGKHEEPVIDTKTGKQKIVDGVPQVIRTDAQHALDEFEKTLNLQIREGVDPAKYPLGYDPSDNTITILKNMEDNPRAPKEKQKSLRELIDDSINDVALKQVAPYEFVLLQKTKEAKIYSKGGKRVRFGRNKKVTNYIIDVMSDDVLPVLKRFKGEDIKATDSQTQLMITQYPRKTGFALKSDPRTGQKRGRPFVQPDPKLEYFTAVKFQNPENIPGELSYRIRENDIGEGAFLRRHPLQELDPETGMPVPGSFGTRLTRVSDGWKYYSVPPPRATVLSRIPKGEITKQAEEVVSILKSELAEKEADLKKLSKQKVKFNKNKKKDQEAVRQDIANIKRKLEGDDNEVGALEQLRAARAADRTLWMINSLDKLGAGVTDTRINPAYAGNIDLIFRASGLKEDALRYNILREIRNDPNFGTSKFNLRQETIMDRLIKTEGLSDDQVKTNRALFRKVYESIIKPEGYTDTILAPTKEGWRPLKNVLARRTGNVRNKPGGTPADGTPEEAAGITMPINLKEGLKLKSQEQGKNITDFVNTEYKDAENKFTTSFNNYVNAVNTKAHAEKYTPGGIDINAFMLFELRKYDKNVDKKYASLVVDETQRPTSPEFSAALVNDDDVGTPLKVISKIPENQHINVFGIIDSYDTALRSEVGVTAQELEDIRKGTFASVEQTKKMSYKDMITAAYESQLKTKEATGIIPEGSVKSYLGLVSQYDKLKNTIQGINNDIDFIDYVRFKENPTKMDYDAAIRAKDRLAKHIVDVEMNADVTNLAKDIEKFHVKLEKHNRDMVTAQPSDQFPATAMDKLGQEMRTLDKKYMLLDDRFAEINKKKLGIQAQKQSTINIRGTDNDVEFQKGATYTDKVKAVEAKQQEILTGLDEKINKREKLIDRLYSIDQTIQADRVTAISSALAVSKYEQNMTSLFAELLDMIGVKADTYVPAASTPGPNESLITGNTIGNKPPPVRINKKTGLPMPVDSEGTGDSYSAAKFFRRQPFENELKNAERIAKKIESHGIDAFPETHKKLKLVKNKNGIMKIMVNVASTDETSGNYRAGNERWVDIANIVDVDGILKNMRKTLYQTQLNKKPQKDIDIEKTIDEIAVRSKQYPPTASERKDPNMIVEQYEQARLDEEYISRMNDGIDSELPDDIVEDFFTKNRYEASAEGVVDSEDIFRGKSEPLGTDTAIEEQIRQLHKAGIIPTKVELKAKKDAVQRGKKATDEELKKQKTAAEEKKQKVDEARRKQRLVEINSTLNTLVKQYKEVKLSKTAVTKLINVFDKNDKPKTEARTQKDNKIKKELLRKSTLFDIRISDLKSNMRELLSEKQKIVSQEYTPLGKIQTLGNLKKKISSIVEQYKEIQNPRQERDRVFIGPQQPNAIQDYTFIGPQQPNILKTLKIKNTAHENITNARQTRAKLMSEIDTMNEEINKGIQQELLGVTSARSKLYERSFGTKAAQFFYSGQSRLTGEEVSGMPPIGSTAESLGDKPVLPRGMKGTARQAKSTDLDVQMAESGFSSLLSTSPVPIPPNTSQEVQAAIQQILKLEYFDAMANKELARRTIAHKPFESSQSKFTESMKSLGMATLEASHIMKYKQSIQENLQARMNTYNEFRDKSSAMSYELSEFITTNFNDVKSYKVALDDLSPSTKKYMSTIADELNASMKGDKIDPEDVQDIYIQGWRTAYSKIADVPVGVDVTPNGAPSSLVEHLTHSGERAQSDTRFSNDWMLERGRLDKANAPKFKDVMDILADQYSTYGVITERNLPNAAIDAYARSQYGLTEDELVNIIENAKTSVINEYVNRASKLPKTSTTGISPEELLNAIPDKNIRKQIQTAVDKEAERLKRQKVQKQQKTADQDDFNPDAQVSLRENLDKLKFVDTGDMSVDAVKIKHKYAAAVAIKTDLENHLMSKLKSLRKHEKDELIDAWSKSKIPSEIELLLTGTGQMANKYSSSTSDLPWVLLENQSRTKATGIGNSSKYMGARIKSFVTKEQAFASMKNKDQGLTKKVEKLTTKVKNYRGGVSEWTRWEITQPIVSLMQRERNAILTKIAELPEDVRNEAISIMDNGLDSDARYRKLNDESAQIIKEQNIVMAERKKVEAKMQKIVPKEMMVEVEEAVSRSNPGISDVEKSEMVVSELMKKLNAKKQVSNAFAIVRFPASAIEEGGKGSVKVTHVYDVFYTGVKDKVDEITTRRGYKNMTKSIKQMEQKMKELRTVEGPDGGKIIRSESEWSRLPIDTQKQLFELKDKIDVSQRLVDNYRNMSRGARLRQTVSGWIGPPLREAKERMSEKFTGVDNKQLFDIVAKTETDPDIIARAKTIREAIAAEKTARKPVLSLRRMRQPFGGIDVEPMKLPSLTRIKDEMTKSRYAKRIAQGTDNLKKIQMMQRGPTIKHGLDFHVQNVLGSARVTKGGEITWDESIVTKSKVAPSLSPQDRIKFLELEEYRTRLWGPDADKYAMNTAEGKKAFDDWRKQFKLADYNYKEVVEPTRPLSMRQLSQMMSDKTTYNKVVKKIQQETTAERFEASVIPPGQIETSFMGSDSLEIFRALDKRFKNLTNEITDNERSAGKVVPRLDVKKSKNMVRQFFKDTDKLPDDARNIAYTNVLEEGKIGPQPKRGLREFMTDAIGNPVKSKTADVFGDVLLPPRLKPKGVDYKTLDARKKELADREVGAKKQLETTVTEFTNYLRMQEKGISDTSGLGRVKSRLVNIGSKKAKKRVVVVDDVDSWTTVENEVAKIRARLGSNATKKDIEREIKKLGLRITPRELKSVLNKKQTKSSMKFEFEPDTKKSIPGGLNIGPDSPSPSGKPIAVVVPPTGSPTSNISPAKIAEILTKLEQKRRAEQQVAVWNLISHGEAEAKRKKRYVDATLAAAWANTITIGPSLMENTGFGQEAYAMPPGANAPKGPALKTPTIQMPQMGMTLSDQGRQLAGLGRVDPKIKAISAFKIDGQYGLRADVIPKYKMGQIQTPIQDAHQKTRPILTPIIRQGEIQTPRYEYNVKPIQMETEEYKTPQMIVPISTFWRPPPTKTTTTPRPKIPLAPLPPPLIFTGGARPRRRDNRKFKPKKKMAWAVPDVWFGHWDPEEYAVQGTKKFKQYNKFQSIDF